MVSNGVQGRIDKILTTFTARRYGTMPTSEDFAYLARAITDEVGAPVVVFLDHGTLYGYVLPFPTVYVRDENKKQGG